MVIESSNNILPNTLDFVLNKEWLFLHQYLYRIELYLINERDSFIVTTYSLLEHHIKIICKLLEEKQKIFVKSLYMLCRTLR